LQRAHLGEHRQTVDRGASRCPDQHQDPAVGVHRSGDESAEDAAAGEPHARRDHRHRGYVAAHQPQQIGRSGRESDSTQAERKGQSARVRVTGARRNHGDTRDTRCDCAHREHVAAPDRLVQVALAEEQQNEEAEGECGLHHDDWREQQRDDLKRPAEDRDGCAGQPALLAYEPADERQTQRVFCRHRARLHRLHRHAGREQRRGDRRQRDSPE